MSEDCSHGHSSQVEESYFYKETQRLIDQMRAALTAAAAQMAAPTLAPLPVPVPVERKPRLVA